MRNEGLALVLIVATSACGTAAKNSFAPDSGTDGASELPTDGGLGPLLDGSAYKFRGRVYLDCTHFIRGGAVPGGPSNDDTETGAGAAFTATGDLPRSYFDAPGICTTTTTNGPCLISTCTIPKNPPTPHHVSAGSISISGGPATVFLKPDDGDGHYSLSLSDTAKPAFLGGEKLAYVASGDFIPAFSGTVVAPMPLTVTQPTFDPDGGRDQIEKPQIDRSAAWAFDWSEGSIGSVHIRLDSAIGSSATSATVAICTFDSPLTHGEVPAAVLSAFPAGDVNFSMYRAITRQATTGDSKEVKTADVYVELLTFTGARTPSDREPPDGVTLR